MTARERGDASLAAGPKPIIYNIILYIIIV